LCCCVYATAAVAIGRLLLTVSSPSLEDFHSSSRQLGLRSGQQENAERAPPIGDAVDTTTRIIEPYFLSPELTVPTPEQFGWPLVHVVQSRFQIGQGKLTNLAKARLELFKHFTYPSMIGQTSQRFLWLIHVGHELNSALFQEIVDMMKSHDNVYVIQNDFPSGRFGLRGFEELQFLEGMANFTIYTGNQTRLELAMAIGDIARRRKNKKKGVKPIIPVVTTRLDMDDAVESTFFEKVQETTLKEFVYSSNPPKYLFWCTLNTLEWNFVWNQTLGGYVKPMAYTKCPSTGLTVTGTHPEKMGLGEHTWLIEKLASHSSATDAHGSGEGRDAFFGCGYSNSSDCLVVYPELKGFRSRAPTSNSYFLSKTWDTDQSQFRKFNKGYQRKLADELYERFLIEVTKTTTTTKYGGDSSSSIVHVNNYFNDHLCDIVSDFTASYCSTRGFTCTDEANEEYDKLRSMLNCTHMH
jgi:hypothetical protein